MTKPQVDRMLNLPPSNPPTCIRAQCARCRYPEPHDDAGHVGDSLNYRCPLCGQDVIEEKYVAAKKRRD